MGEEMAESNEVIAEMIELLSEEDGDGISEVVASQEREPTSIVSAYNTINGSSTQATWPGVALVAAMTGALFF
jgi:hypothetical protein